MEVKNNIPQKAGADFKTMFSITFTNLRVAPYRMEKLLDVYVEQKINEHGRLYFKGILLDQQEMIKAEDAASGKKVILCALDDTGNNHILFQGIVDNIEITAVQGVHYIEVHAVSYSFLLDIEHKSRSFQNKTMAYQQLIQQVTNDHPGASVYDVATGGAATDKFIVQHLETDWEFLKRLASRFHTGLICDFRHDAVRYYFGISESKTEVVTLDAFNYSVRKDVKRFKELSENGIKGLHENDFIYYEVKTNKAVQIGDKVNFQGKTLFVYSVIGKLEQGIFLNHCVLTSKKGLSQPYLSHDKVVGASFGGCIIEIKNDRVKVHLNIDQKQDQKTACFFPYSTIYSSQSGSGWYCMPELGDKVRIYCPDGEEDHAYAISSVHEAVTSSQGTAIGRPGDYSGQRDDPNVKSLRNASGKEIRLTQDGIYVIGGDGTMIILTNDDGVEIKSKNDINFKSDKNIMISANEEIQIIGNESLNINSGDTASIKIESNVEIIGQEVKAN